METYPIICMTCGHRDVITASKLAAADTETPLCKQCSSDDLDLDLSVEAASGQSDAYRRGQEAYRAGEDRRVPKDLFDPYHEGEPGSQDLTGAQEWGRGWDAANLADDSWKTTAGTTFDGEPSYSNPDMRGDDDAYDTCPNCGKPFYLGDPTCGHCGKSPIGPDGHWGKSAAAFDTNNGEQVPCKGCGKPISENRAIQMCDSCTKERGLDYNTMWSQRSAAVAVDIARTNPDLPPEVVTRLAAKVAARIQG